jgi:peptidoglycan/LPS O-acetylase OafA/YrhL
MTATASPVQPRPRIPHLEVLRLVPMLGVVATHSLMFTQPAESLGSNGVLIFLHANREIFFFVSAFVLVYSSGALSGRAAVARFWRRRYPLVLVPYLAWTFIYWIPVGGLPWPPGPALRQLVVNLTTGWFHLYFLLVTMQLYLAFPLLAWLIRRTAGHHRLLLALSLTVQLAFTALMQYAWGWAPGWLQGWLGQAQIEATSYQLYFIAGGLAATHMPEVLAWLHAHRRASLLGALAAAAAVCAVYGLNVRFGRTVQGAANVFQPAVALAVAAGLVFLFWAADALATRLPADGRTWRALLTASRASFGVYLGHMVVLQLLVLTPAAAVIGVAGLPAPLRALAVLIIVFGVTLAAVLLVQATPLSAILTGRSQVRTPRLEAGLWDLLHALWRGAPQRGNAGLRDGIDFASLPLEVRVKEGVTPL